MKESGGELRSTAWGWGTSLREHPETGAGSQRGPRDLDVPWGAGSRESWE